MFFFVITLFAFAFAFASAQLKDSGARVLLTHSRVPPASYAELSSTASAATASSAAVAAASPASVVVVDREWDSRIARAGETELELSFVVMLGWCAVFCALLGCVIVLTLDSMGLAQKNSSSLRVRFCALARARVRCACPAAATNPTSGVLPADLVYIVYTSGTTGQPKVREG